MGNKKISEFPSPPDSPLLSVSSGLSVGGKGGFLIDSFVTKMELRTALSQVDETIGDLKRQGDRYQAAYQADQLDRNSQISQLNNSINNLTLDINELEKAMVEKEEKFNKKLRTQESWIMVFGLLLIVLFIWTTVLTLK